jgi:hypothetical protein
MLTQPANSSAMAQLQKAPAREKRAPPLKTDEEGIAGEIPVIVSFGLTG